MVDCVRKHNMMAMSSGKAHRVHHSNTSLKYLPDISEQSERQGQKPEVVEDEMKAGEEHEEITYEYARS